MEESWEKVERRMDLVTLIQLNPLVRYEVD